MLEVSVKPMMMKSGVFALVLLMLSLLAPVSLRASKKKKQSAAPSAPTQKAEVPDFTKIVFPYPPAVPRVRYLDYFSASPIQTSEKKKTQKKERWMDRLAGVDPNQGTDKGPKPRYHLYAPYGVAVDSKGLLYVADTKVGAIFIFNTETGDVALIKNGIDARLKSIIGLAIDDSDHLYVSDNAANEVMEFDAKHKFVGSFGNGILRDPCGIALDLENRFLYVVDTGLDQVVVFDADTHALLRKIGTTGKNHTLTDPGNFSKPTNAAVDKDGNLYVTDTLNDRVEVFDADGNFVRTFGQNGDSVGSFARPKGIAIDSDGHVWVADAMLNRVQVFTPEGRPLMAFGDYGIQPAQFQALTGLAFDTKRHRFFSAEQMYGRIQMFRYYTDDEARAELEKRKEGNVAKSAEKGGATGTTAVGDAVPVKDAAQAQPAAATQPQSSQVAVKP